MIFPTRHRAKVACTSDSPGGSFEGMAWVWRFVEHQIGDRRHVKRTPLSSTGTYIRYPVSGMFSVSYTAGTLYMLV